MVTGGAAVVERTRRVLGGVLTALVAAAIASPPPTSAFACAGDCDGGGDVTVNEIISMVNIALGNADNSACLLGIPPGSAVDISLIIQAVNNALNGCAVGPTDTPTMTATTTATQIPTAPTTTPTETPTEIPSQTPTVVPTRTATETPRPPMTSDLAGNWVFHNLYVTRGCGGSGYSTGSGTLAADGCGSFTVTGSDNEGGSIGGVFALCATLGAEGTLTLIDTTRGVTVFDNGALSAGENMVVGNGIDTSNGARDVDIIMVTRRASQYALADLAGNWAIHNLYVTRTGGGSGYGTATGTLDSSGCGDFAVTGFDNEGGSFGGVDQACVTLDAQGTVTVVDTTRGVTLFNNGVLSADKNAIVGNGIDTTDGARDVGIVVVTRRAVD
jgi:hypothetical protein